MTDEKDDRPATYSVNDVRKAYDESGVAGATVWIKSWLVPGRGAPAHCVAAEMMFWLDSFGYVMPTHASQAKSYDDSKGVWFTYKIDVAPSCGRTARRRHRSQRSCERSPGGRYDITAHRSAMEVAMYLCDKNDHYYTRFVRYGDNL